PRHHPDFPSVSRGAQDSRETGLRAGFLLSAIWLIRPANKKRQRWSRDAAFYPSCCLPSSAKKIYHSRRQKEAPRMRASCRARGGLHLFGLGSFAHP
ncbi:hypothetical protein, partial [Pseudomonas aeruginosa]|uniref:hypothetical protein n=1 Tax=Pseudomonas aeruginosa TaxID=287 RepID=UPI001C8B0E7C